MVTPHPAFLGVLQKSRSALRFGDEFLIRRGGFLLWIFAFVYYGLYHNAGLTLTGEAGSNALIAIRILEGWRPIKDMFVGYNLLWFYPLSGLFLITGPNLWVTQIFFMTLSALTGWLGFSTLRRCTGCGWIAFLAAVLMILMPGGLFRNYMGFLAVLGAYALIRGYITEASTALRQCAWMGFCGAAMSICFLIRIEPSLLLSIVWIGLVVLYPLGARSQFLHRLRIVCAGTAIGLVAFAAVHAPFVIHAYNRGFGPEFTGQYLQFVKMLGWELQKEFNKTHESVEKPPTPENAQSLDKPPVRAISSDTTIPEVKSQDSSDGRRQRPNLSELFKNGRISYFSLSIFFPLISATVLTIFGFALFLWGAVSGTIQKWQGGLCILTSTGCALSLFPQYFFFRPDSVHLAEFMVPFYLALGFAAAAAMGLFRSGRARAWIAGLILMIVGIQIFVAFNALFNREGSGSIRCARGKTALFDSGSAGKFRVKPDEQSDWKKLLLAICENSNPREAVVTYPYVPVLNVLAQRPSYQFKLYVDNATEGPDFSENAIREFDIRKPAVVVVNNRDINKTEFSRFKNWAAPFYNHVAMHYRHAGTFLGIVEVFVRPTPVEVLDKQPEPDPRK